MSKRKKRDEALEALRVLEIFQDGFAKGRIEFTRPDAEAWCAEMLLHPNPPAVVLVYIAHLRRAMAARPDLKRIVIHVQEREQN